MLSTLTSILGHMAEFVTGVIELLGYPGLVFLMALESMVVPLPSELVMPFAGFLVAKGSMTFGGVVGFSTLGSLIGSLLSYAMGYYGGRPVVLKIGKYLFLNPAHLEATERWFKAKGEVTIFVSRLIPVVRHLISIPAGMGRMALGKFCVFTVAGAALWNAILTYFGYLLGENWELIRRYSEKVSLAVAGLLVVGAVAWVAFHLKNSKKKNR